MLETISSVAEVRARVRAAQRSGLSVGFVPTMGALHAGHAALMDAARRENDLVVVSIFVNPLQFDRQADLDTYPRTLAEDTALCGAHGVSLLFAPRPEDLYPQKQFTFVDCPDLTQTLCGQFRPGHFRGMATVVLKLLQAVPADRAYFGEKDAQQLAIIERMVADLNVPVAIVPVPTVREPDGLALSSRNRHLTPEQRALAVHLSRALYRAAERLDAGASVSAAQSAGLELLAGAAIRVEYFEIVDPQTLQPAAEPLPSLLLAGAIWLGATRLIDNVRWGEK